MIYIISFLEKYVLSFETFMAIMICILSLLFMKTDADLQKLKSQAIGHGFAKYDETKGNWRWITEEDMLR
jgi:hypothetical protein